MERCYGSGMRMVQRKLQEIPHQDIARRVGISKSMMSHIVKGKRTPSLQVAVKLAREIGCSLDELVGFLDQAAAA